MSNVQIFGVKGSQATRAADRFFKERRIPIQFVDLARQPMAPGEIKRFIDRFGLLDLVDRDGKSYETGGLKYMKLSDLELIAKIERDPKLLRLPLVRFGTQLSIGDNRSAWKEMIEKSVAGR
jgi:arsenate reductase